MLSRERDPLVVRDQFDYVVIGAGIMGLSTAWHLARRGKGNVALLDAYEVGHDRGSSQGAVRIARSTYADPGYVALMSRAREESWPLWEDNLGSSLITPMDAYFFGPEDGLIQGYIEGVRDLGDRIQPLSKAAARSEFPQLRNKNHCVLRDTTAGSIDAAKARTGIRRQLIGFPNVSVIEHCRVLNLDDTGSGIGVCHQEGELIAQKVVITAGPWTAQLIPQAQSRLMVHRQDIGYFGQWARPGQVGVPNPWVYLGHDQDQVYYGLPEDAGHMKAARHRRSGPEIEPDWTPESDALAMAEVEDFVRAEFTGDMHLAWSSTCPYTSTETDDFILDCHPEDARLVIGAGFSGHGFKFAPLVGRILADLAVDADCKIPEYQSMKEQFSL